MVNKPDRFDRYLAGLTPEEKDQLTDKLLDGLTIKEEEPPSLTTAVETVPEAEKLLAQAGKIVGLTSGYEAIDKMTKGMAFGDLIIIYGDTSHGKSQLTQNITYRLAREGQPVLFIGLEMTNAQNTTRFMSIGKGDELCDYALLNIMYPTDNDLNYGNIEPYIKAASEAGAKLVVIDQLQQLIRSVDNTTNETSLITHEIKRMAIKYQVAVILISHINRSGQTSAAPTLRELKGSSSIEQDADICIAVWRDMDPRNNMTHVLEVWLRKNRNRGMEFFHTELTVEDGVRLVETKTLALPKL